MTSMTMLKASCGAFLLLALALSPKPAMAQDSETVAPPHRASSRYKRPTLDDRVAVLSKNLELTEAQRSAVKRFWSNGSNRRCASANQRRRETFASNSSEPFRRERSRKFAPYSPTSRRRNMIP